MTLLLPPNGTDDKRKIVQAINQVILGKVNSIGAVTLTHDVASTTVINALVSKSSTVLLMPQTANAAAELATAYIDPAGITDGESFVITHANNAQTDRVFAFAILG